MRARSGGRGRRRRGRRTSTAAALAGTTALGDVGSRGGALGGDVDGGGARGARAVGGAGERTAGGRKGEGGRKEIYGGAFVPGEATTREKRSFCPGWWLHPGQKGLLGGPGKFPARGPPLVPGRSTTRDKRGRFPSFPPNVMFVFVSFYFSFKIGFHLLIQLIKL